MRSNPKTETSEAYNEKCIIQEDKCTDMLHKIHIQTKQLIDEFKRLELERIQRIKSFLWTFHQLITGINSMTHTACSNAFLTDLKKEILAIDPESSLKEIDQYCIPITLENVTRIEKTNAAKFYLRAFLKELFY